LLGWHLTPGQRADVCSAPRLIRHLPKRIGTLVADRGYDSDAIVNLAKSRGLEAAIPSRRGRRFPRAFCQHRYLIRTRVENYFARLKHLRRIATRYNKHVSMWASFFLAGNLIIASGIKLLDAS